MRQAKPKTARNIALIVSLWLTACGAQPPSFEGELPPLAAHLDCLPRDAAIISAHRATVYDWNYPENALGGLYKLSEAGYLMAEIDVARTQDGTHFLVHDGVWDEISTGTGPVSATKDWQLGTLLLKSRKGKISDERPPTLKDALRYAKTKEIYLEIDFKSSARYEEVIDLIHEADMAENVILISYNKKQRDRLAKLAPNILRSSSSSYAKGADLVWAGADATRPMSKALKSKHVIGRVKRPEFTEGLNLAKQQSSILVTDDANRYLPITGLTKKNKTDYVACLEAIEPGR